MTIDRAVLLFAGFMVLLSRGARLFRVALLVPADRLRRR